jgi:hypothetical protein
MDPFTNMPFWRHFSLYILGSPVSDPLCLTNPPYHILGSTSMDLFIYAPLWRHFYIVHVCCTTDI